MKKTVRPNNSLIPGDVMTSPRSPKTSWSVIGLLNNIFERIWLQIEENAFVAAILEDGKMDLSRMQNALEHDLAWDTPLK